MEIVQAIDSKGDISLDRRIANCYAQSPMPPDPKVTTSFRLRLSILDALRQRLPAYGARNYVLEQLVEKFLRGEIKITKPATL